MTLSFGQLVLVEIRAEDASVPIKPEHKMSKAQINKEMNVNGFKLVREFDGLPWQHLMFFRKAGERAAPVRGSEGNGWPQFRGQPRWFRMTCLQNTQNTRKAGLDRNGDQLRSIGPVIVE
ncbi:hypothetical protein [Prosthecobacter sp.]|uniref:hypothetical protein n=1 Tax=Prosthecobacter sp. TaxID=1965333 RepID=UPI0037834AAC